MSPAIATVISSSITALITLIVCLINSDSANRKMQEDLRLMLNDFKNEIDKNRAVTDEKIKALTEETKKHNSLVERTYRLEAENDVQNEKISELEHKVDKQ